jgi:hypothetical protein
VILDVPTESQTLVFPGISLAAWEPVVVRRRMRK